MKFILCKKKRDEKYYSSLLIQYQTRKSGIRTCRNMQNILIFPCKGGNANIHNIRQ